MKRPLDVTCIMHLADSLIQGTTLKGWGFPCSLYCYVIIHYWIVYQSVHIIKMAALRTPLLCISCTVWMIICSLPVALGDVPDDIVYTDLHKTVQLGDSVVLKCQFRGTPLAVYWKKGDDPRTAPNLVSWIPGDPVTGLCEGDRPCQIMEMNEDFSLIIKEVRITEQGRYICRVSSYKGVLIHNFTDVKLFSPPMEPFPVIDECQAMLPNDTCTISTSAGTTITCSTSNYFPDIDLFFLQGSHKMDTTNSKEVTNLDGTKNKSISTVAEPSENPYVCVASDIPGSQDQRAVAFEVNFVDAKFTTIPLQTTVSPIGGVAEVVVPVVIVFVLLAVVCVFIPLWCREKQRRSIPKDDTEAMLLHKGPKIEGKISFYELWYMIEEMNVTNLQTLKDALIDLGITVDKAITPKNAYELLCEWKDTNTYDDEGRRLYNTLSGYGLGGPFECATRRRDDGDAAISEERLDYILRQIANKGELGRFLGELSTDKQESRLGLVENNDNSIKEAMEEMMKWRERIKNGNHFILLSLALERAKCRPLDRTFFRVPEHLLKSISPQEIKGFVYRLTGRHCTRLAGAVGITDESKIATIMNGNNEDLFDTQAMISDWKAGQECTHFEKRCRLDDAIIRIGRHDITDFFGTTSYRTEAGDTVEKPHPHANSFDFGSIFKDDLAVLLKHLPPNARPLFLEKLGISIDKEDTIEGKLQGWRDDSISQSKIIPLQKLVSIHIDVLEETNYSQVHDVKDGELENAVECITSAKQMKELISRLGINIKEGQSQSEHLKEWRDNCAMEKRRETLRETLSALGLSGCIVDRLPPQYVYQAEMVRFAYNILCSDVEPLATLLDMDTTKEKIVREPLKGTVGLLMRLLDNSKGLDTHRRRDFSIVLRNLGYLDAARSAYFGYEGSLSELYNMTSGLSKDEMEKLIDHLDLEKDVMGTTEQPDNLKVMKVWRNQLRPEPIHFRLKLALALRAIGQNERADDILAGRFRTTEVSSYVVESICNSMDDHQLDRLCKHLKLKTKRTQDDQTTTTTTLVAEWVINWLNEFDKFSLKGFLTGKRLVSRVNENDELFTAGFFELAEEIMLLGVSKLISVKPANKEFDEMCNENEAEDKPASAESVKTGSEDKAGVPNPSSAECDEASGDQKPEWRSAMEEGEETPGENAQLIANTAHIR